MKVFLYDEGTCSSLRVAEVAAELERITGLGAEVRPEFVAYWAAQGRQDSSRLSRTGRQLVEGHPDALAAALVAARVHDPLRRGQPVRRPAPVELAAECRALTTPGHTSVGILYDGALLQMLLGELLPGNEAAHIAITARLLGTYADADARWHAHTSLYGEPSLLSTSGLVQAPARPREYYQGQALTTSGLVPREVVESELQRKLRDRMLLPNDPRITRVMVGYVLQCLAFHLRGSPFCPTPTCPLYNARRQEELIRAQLSDESTLCPTHRELFNVQP